MRKKFFTIVTTTALFLITASLSFAQTNSDPVPDWVKKTKISGLVFGDYYFVADNHNEELNNKNGFWLRRVYVTFDHQLQKNLSARVRFEAGSPGDFKSSERIVPFVKHMYLDWKANDNHSVYFGLSSPPTYSVVEDVWGYRAVEKTPLDLYGFAPSSDFGVAVKGQLNSKFKYHTMVANGAGTNGETNSGKRAMFSLGYYPNKTFLVEGYVDTEGRPENVSRQTYQAFAGLKTARGRAGFLLTRVHHTQINLEDNLDLASVFGVYDLTEKMSVLSRYDRMFDPNPNGEKISYLPFHSKAKSNFVLLGLDYKTAKNLSLIPNVEFIFYDGVTPKPRSDIMPRFTVYFTF